MSAGIPIVPIVIRNAEVIAARDSSTFNPGTVDVVVYPPIPVDDWTRDNLPERIAEVRDLYLDTLKDWPQGELPTPSLYTRKTTRKPAPKKATTKKATANKAAATKATAKKAAAKKTPAKKTATKRAAPKGRP
jgi:putative phosphoserine phosphatase/1-acylglycerol-3-phosphate O-acyltransferase